MGYIQLNHLSGYAGSAGWPDWEQPFARALGPVGDALEAGQVAGVVQQREPAGGRIVNGRGYVRPGDADATGRAAIAERNSATISAAAPRRVWS